MKSLFSSVLSHRLFHDQPLVIVDVGASGGRWKTCRPVADMSVLLEFDPDERDFSTRSSNNTKGWRNIRVNKGVSTKSGEEVLFLTDAPHCSSLLKPSREDIANWLFRDLFSVSDTHTVKVISLSQALEEYAVRGIDFLKLDTQGLDLDIVRSLGLETLRQISLLELEPGLAPIYAGEGKVVDVLAFMEEQPFWLSHLGPQGVLRTRQYGIHDRRLFRYALQLAAAKGAVWATMRYLNTCAGRPLNKRLLLTTWLAAMLTGHFGFALDVAALGRATDDSIFDLMEEGTRRVIFRRAALIAPVKALKLGWTYLVRRARLT